MGYTTEFYGQIQIYPPLDKDLIEYLDEFTNVRHMKRDNLEIIKNDPDYLDKCLDNNILGTEGEFYLGNDNPMYSHDDPTVIDINLPPITQPGLWCDWEVTKDGKAIRWNGAEKFYDYVEWLNYLIDKIFTPRGYALSGAIDFQGESWEDKGIIEIHNGKAIKRMYKFYLEPYPEDIKISTSPTAVIGIPSINTDITYVNTGWTP